MVEKAGISEGFLSQMENNVKVSSVETLINICAVLGVEVGGIMNELQNKEQFFLIRQAEWEEVDIPHIGFATRRFCPPLYRLVVDSAMFFIEPGKSIPCARTSRTASRRSYACSRAPWS